MPTISRFLGIKIKMYLRDHPPPHFHANYGAAEGKFGIDPLLSLTGDLPPRVVRLVREWGMKHRPELRANWRRIEMREPPLARIKGLDEED